MILVWGKIDIQEGSLERAKELSLEHVHRSRLEPGCISHSVLLDVENPLRLIFNEEWQDMAALQQHFAVPASGEFVRDLSALATSPPTMKIYSASEIEKA